WRDLRRVPTACGTRCVALRGDGGEEPFRCAIYADRPSACRDLERGSWNCWFARRRVGLWPPRARGAAQLAEEVAQAVAEPLELAPETLHLAAIEALGRPFEPVDHEIELPRQVGELPEVPRVRHGARITGRPGEGARRVPRRQLAPRASDSGTRAGYPAPSP